ncbi:NAD binding site [Prochlorococcus marinus str. MIT 9312]|uniref:NAD binding site n=1 Tax=Prochlorococcus marinus (strain MIT 9312) TaxID=74546 RepID=Q31C14_PROM9|nr:NAD(P)/FAD-dependent oxidoreductase [Prochlorococcus marinus]ABB49581.1 NAD binding site [Prochlorococcus marinus str. MIT 9312]KGG01079.1 Geranylgeranyl reductase [Prochlorococcus marinus str. MIT 9311]
MKEFDVVIIGGGLSGSSSALNLSKKGYSVLVIEKENCQDYKPCAGGMASSMQKFLPLDIKDSIESKIKNVEFRWKASDNVTADLTGESPFWIIKREKLDQLLLDESLRNGVQIIRPVLVEKIIKKNDKWEITCNNKRKYISEFLVVADGSQSKWAGYFKLGPRKPKFANTISLRLKGLGAIPRDAVRFEFGFIKYGFAWAFPLKESLNIGLGTFINNGLLENQTINNQVIRSFGFDDLSYKTINKKLRIWNGLHPINNDKVLAVGDAASLCDPFLAEGIRPSLISSFYAAECIDQCLTGKVHDLNLYTTEINNNWGRSMAWGRRIAQVFYRFPRTGYQLGVKRKTAPKRIAQILSGEMNYEDIAKRVIKRLLTKSGI